MNDAARDKNTRDFFFSINTAFLLPHGTCLIKAGLSFIIQHLQCCREWIHGLNDFLPTFLDDIFVFENMEQSEGYVLGDTGTTMVYLLSDDIEGQVLLVCGSSPGFINNYL